MFIARESSDSDTVQGPNNHMYYMCCVYKSNAYLGQVGQDIID